MSQRSDEPLQQILALVHEFHSEQFLQKAFIPGESVVLVSSKVIDANDIGAVVESALDGWFTILRAAGLRTSNGS